VTRKRASDRFDLLVRSKAQFLGFLERRMGNRADAEDLLQTAFLKMVARGESLRDEEKLVPWFYQLLRNLIVDHHRHRTAVAHMQTRVAAEAAAEAAIDDDLFRATCACVKDVIATLKPDHVELVRRVELDGEPLHRAAKGLGLTPNNASVRLHRARRALREALQVTCGICTEHGFLDCACRRDRGR
jgi:RNA polymerase sigma factor (sigma-70 family)